MLSANLLANGAFNQGTAGFATGYFKNGSSLLLAGAYVVGTDPHKYHYAGADFADHTSGTGKMLIVNGSSKAGTVVWRESVNVARGVDYEFSGWAASWATDATTGGDISPAQVQINIDGKPVSTTSLPSTPGQWTTLTGAWLADSSRATITITDLNTAVSGNDSAYDDFSFSPLASIHGSVISAAVSANGKLNEKHSPLAGLTLYLDTNNNGIYNPGEPTAVTNKSGGYAFTGLSAGTYHVCQLNPPDYYLPPAQLAVTVTTAGKQLVHENLWDLYTVSVPMADVFR